MNLRLELFVANLERSVDFYKDVLEFEVPKSANNNYIPLKKGNVTLGIGRMDNLSNNHPLKVTNSDQKNGLGVEIVLEVNNIKSVYEKIKERRYPIEYELTKRPWGLEDFRLRDPDGYYLRITSKRDTSEE